jgi:cytochrome c2
MKRGQVSWWVLQASVALCAVAGFVPADLQAEEGVLEGDPFRGRTLFVEKRCVQCHSVWGRGGTLGPEIVRVVARKSLPSLAGSFWNHTPRMIEEMTASGYSWPTLEREEMADILSYLYYVRLFDEPGDPGRGETFYRSLRCEFCHSLGGRGGDSGPALDDYAAYGSPVPLAQAMWNSGPEMQQSQLSSGTPIPEFIGSEIVDMQAYIRESGIQREKKRSELLPLPDPLRGKEIFRAKGCATCHDPGRGGAPELSEAALRMTVGQISGVLWNHSYAMHGQMQREGKAFPRFREHELADVISYLYFISYKGRPGDATRGENVFREKGCSVCHEAQSGQAPDLTELHAGDDSIGLSAAMWNHAPEMHEVMAEYGVAWPKFEEGEMEDMVAFLQALARRSTAGGRGAEP